MQELKQAISQEIDFRKLELKKMKPVPANESYSDLSYLLRAMSFRAENEADFLSSTLLDVETRFTEMLAGLQSKFSLRREIDSKIQRTAMQQDVAREAQARQLEEQQAEMYRSYFLERLPWELRQCQMKHSGDPNLSAMEIELVETCEALIQKHSVETFRSERLGKVKVELSEEMEAIDDELRKMRSTKCAHCGTKGEQLVKCSQRNCDVAYYCGSECERDGRASHSSACGSKPVNHMFCLILFSFCSVVLVVDVLSVFFGSRSWTNGNTI